METVALRFDKFKSFIRQNGKVKEDNVFIQKFMLTPLDFFLATIKSKLSSGVDKQRCLEEIFTLADLKRSDYSDEDIEKLVKYMQYFSEISAAQNFK